MKLKADTFHVLATIANIHGTQQMIDDMVRGEAFTQKDVDNAKALLDDLGYEPEWS